MEMSLRIEIRLRFEDFLNGGSQFDDKRINLLHTVLLINDPRSLLFLLYDLCYCLLKGWIDSCFLLQLLFILFEFCLILDPNPFFDDSNNVFSLANGFFITREFIPYFFPF
jgi:hypothetical protein